MIGIGAAFRANQKTDSYSDSRFRFAADRRPLSLKQIPLSQGQKGGILKKYIRAVVSTACAACLLSSISAIAQSESTDTVLALVNGEPVTTAQLKPFLPPDFDTFVPEKASAVQKVALENAVISTILRAEARRRKMPVHLLRKQMTAGRISVLNSQVEEEYRKNARYFGLMSPDEIKERLRLDLEAEQRMKFYKDALSRLKALAKVEIRLQSPQPAIISVKGNGPSRGVGSAPVTITVFSDFECPYCKNSSLVLDRLLKEYPDSIRLVYRHLPLKGAMTGLTPATAAICADRQGSFWKFHDSVYQRDSFTPTELRRAADAAELDMDQFDECVRSGRANEVIVADVTEARRLKIDGTPTFIINDRMYKGALEFDEFKKIIEGELTSSSRGRNP